MMRSTHAPGRGRMAVVAVLALMAVASSAQAWARMGGGGHFGGRGGFSGGHPGFAGRGGFVHGHGGGHFRGAVVIGGLGLWSLYPYPAYPYYAYPYPYPYAPAVVVPGYNALPPGQVWYYCDAAAGYYPYVTTCPGPWREVPAAPEQSGPGPAP